MSPTTDCTWDEPWRGRWIWDHEPEEAFWWRPTAAEPHDVYLRKSFEMDEVPAALPARVSCDSRYVLFVNGHLVGRGPVRGEPERLGWDDYDLVSYLVQGSNVVTALCRYYGSAGPWWIPAVPSGTLGRGSFCFETSLGAPVELLSDTTWRAAPAPWVHRGEGAMHSFPPEVVDGRLAPTGIHDPRADADDWSQAVIVGGRGHGTVLDRPPAAPYMTPLRRPIPQLTSTRIEPTRLDDGRRARVVIEADPVATWSSVDVRGDGDRVVSVWDLGFISLGYVMLRVTGAGPAVAGSVIDVVGGEDLRVDGLPEVSPRRWAARYLLAGQDEEIVQFFDPIGLRYLAVHHDPVVSVEVQFEEATYPREQGAEFDCDDTRYAELWRVGVRTVDVCSTDAFLDCPGREQRAWVSDAYPQILVSLVTNPDQRLVRHHLALTAQGRWVGGLLAGAAGCDFARIGFTMPDYSLHWIRTLAAYWSYSGDEPFVRGLLPVANAIIERFEEQRGTSGLLEDFPGWVFLDWAQVDRNVVTGAHDGLYAAALVAYGTLPGSEDVSDLLARTSAGFEALWDASRRVYVDAIGPRGVSRRVSQHTNAAALLGGIVPADRVTGVIERIVDPGGSGLGGRLVVTPTSADALSHGRVPYFQFEDPEDFDPERDVVAAQPWFCRFLHEALFQHDRRDLILSSLLRWKVISGNETFQEFWDAAPGRSSRCHGWASSPAFDLTSYILGCRPVSPGFARAVIDPYLGAFTRVSGRVPTPLGWLAAEVRDGEVRLEVPDGMSVDVGGAQVTSGRQCVPLRAGTDHAPPRG